MHMRLKINFTDFWPTFNKQDNFFWNLLSLHYRLEISEEPDVLFFSVFGEKYKEYRCLRIFFTGEHYEPKLYNADLSVSFSRIEDERNYRFPLYALFFDLRDLLRKPSPDIIASKKSKFCCFVVSNKSCKIRNEFFKRLSKYKRVDSGGKYLNNVGGPVNDKRAFISQYKFVISFENTIYPGYVTEKIVEAMYVNSIPIYWGDPTVHLDFNTRSFVNVHEYKNMADVIKRVIELDNNDALYKNMLLEPWFEGNQVNPQYLHESLLKKLVEVIENRNPENFAALHHETILDVAVDKMKRIFRGERKFG